LEYGREQVLVCASGAVCGLVAPKEMSHLWQPRTAFQMSISLKFLRQKVEFPLPFKRLA
jgi:hypothetical protein